MELKFDRDEVVQAIFEYAVKHFTTVDGEYKGTVKISVNIETGDIRASVKDMELVEKGEENE